MKEYQQGYSKEELESVFAYLHANGVKDDEISTIEREGRYLVLYAGRGGVSVNPILRRYA